MYFEEPTLFDIPADMPVPHARRSDPSPSDVVQASLGKDSNLRRLIYESALTLWLHHEERINDTMLWEYMERHFARRFQRNVIARARDIAQDLGFFEGVGIFPYTDSQGRTRDLVHYVPILIGEITINPNPKKK